MKERKLTRTGFRPELVARFVVGVRFDVKDVEGVAFVGEIIDGPLQRRLTALGEIHGHPDFPVFHHCLTFSAFFLSL